MTGSRIRSIRIDGDIAYVPLSQGYVAIIDAADVPLVDGVAWTAAVQKNAVYACRVDRSGDNPRKIYLHRVIIGSPSGLDVDHVDGNGLNNRRSNLRAATRSENLCNRRITDRNTSGFKGVSWNKAARKWQAYIKRNGKRHSLGHHHTPEAAHAAYCAASEQLHGEFGRTA